MNEDQKNRYFYMMLGQFGIFLIGLSMFRNLAIHDDPLGEAMILFGFIMLITYVRFLEGKFGVTKKESRISTVFAIALMIMAFIFYPPWGTCPD